MQDNTDPGIRKLNQWALEQLERTRRAYEQTAFHDPEEKRKMLAFVDAQIAEKRAALAE